MGTFAIVALLVAILFVVQMVVRRSHRRTRQTGLTAEATIMRMEGGGGEGSANTFRLTLEWSDPSGVTRVHTVNKACALANMPQQGDRVRIYYPPDRLDLLTFSTDEPLRRDELEHLAPERA